MGLTKSDLFTPAQNELAQIGKALGHPARISILLHLLESDICICGDLVAEIGLAQATISQHLSVLKSVGLIKGNMEGTSLCYCIDKRRWEEIKHVFTLFLSREPKIDDRCC
jgi:DNA-binding transcriptional ArsR family regulator